MRRFDERTIYRWLAAYEAKGIAGIAKKQRQDKGSRRVLVSRAWDALVLPRAEQERIAGALVTFVRSLWAGPTVFAGWRVTATHASAELRKLTAGAMGVPLAKVAKQACAVPRSFVEREREYRAVGIHGRDRKRHEDRTRPRISRGLPEWPMQIVMGDVHPLDIYYTRDDGSAATAKLIAFLDVGTGRLRLQPEFLEKGKGVREAHVIGAFIAMVQDPLWGLPAALYLDNGSEYQWDRFIDDAMALADMHVFAGAAVTPLRGAAIRAQPYNAAAKGVLEGAFHQLEQRFFSLIPGWIGGDRLRSKAANIGQAPVRYPGSKDDLIADIRRVEAAFNATAQQGRLKGHSPNDRFTALVERGWKRTDMDEADLYAAFCAREPRRIRQGRLRHAGRDFYDDALASLPAGTLLSIGIPKWGETGRISVYDEHGRYLCMAQIDRPFAHDDAAGAIEAARRRKIATDAVRAKKARTRPIDGRALLAAEAASAESVPVPERGAVVRFNDNQRAAGQALSTAPPLLADRQRQQASEARARQFATLRKLRRAEG